MLVEDDPELVVPLAHPVDRVGQGQSVRQQQWAPGERTRRGGGEAVGGQMGQLAHAQDARDVVGVVTEDRVVGVAVLGDQLDRLGGRGVPTDEDGVRTRDHHLVQRPIGELQDVVEQVGRVLGYCPCSCDSPIRCPSSSRVAPWCNSSTGSMPTLRRSLLAAPPKTTAPAAAGR